jgi:hypothetical protein
MRRQHETLHVNHFCGSTVRLAFCGKGLAQSGVFPNVFAIAIGVLVWVGLSLRDPRLIRWILLRDL